MMATNEDGKRVELGTLDLAQIEHVAVQAALLGDTEVEGMCDEALAGMTDAELLTAAVHEDERYTEWMERGRLWGWEVRRG
jgi:hypothetical protein